jgi:HSP20 family protein
MFELIPFRRKVGLPRVGDWMDRFFEDVPAFFRTGEGNGEWLPRFDVTETDENIVVKAYMPGIDVNDLDISLSNGVLTVRGEKKHEHKEEKENVHLYERRFGSFCRSFTLPSEVDADKVDAAYKDGVLTLTIPKGEAAKPRKIEVKH